MYIQNNEELQGLWNGQYFPGFRFRVTSKKFVCTKIGVCCDFQFMFLENIDYFRFGGLRRGSTFVLQYAKAIVSMETDVVGT